MKKSKEQFIDVTVKEWYEERDDGVFMVWEFKDGGRMERLLPYTEIPIVEVWWPKDMLSPNEQNMKKKCNVKKCKKEYYATFVYDLCKEHFEQFWEQNLANIWNGPSEQMKKAKRKLICYWIGCKGWDKDVLLCSRCGLWGQWRFGKPHYHKLKLYVHWLRYLIKTI